MEIHIKSIPGSKQRYETVGDYWYDDEGVLQVRVSDMGNEFYEKLVAIHELIEEALTKKRGLTEPEIKDFDEAFERARAMGLRREDEEPGFHNDAPYLREHTLATSCEMMMCALAGESWSDYDRVVVNL
jgi:hypothetical protein